MSNKFWLVWNSASGNPQYRHPSIDSAKQEAKRLALKHPDNEFIVLESLGSVVRNEVVWRGHGQFSEEEIPF